MNAIKEKMYAESISTRREFQIEKVGNQNTQLTVDDASIKRLEEHIRKIDADKVDRAGADQLMKTLERQMNEKVESIETKFKELKRNAAERKQIIDIDSKLKTLKLLSADRQFVMDQINEVKKAGGTNNMKPTSSMPVE